MVLRLERGAADALSGLSVADVLVFGPHREHRLWLDGDRLRREAPGLDGRYAPYLRPLTQRPVAPRAYIGRHLPRRKVRAPMPSTSIEQRLVTLHAHYTSRVNAALAAGRMDLVQDLADDCRDEALDLILAAEGETATAAEVEILELGGLLRMMAPAPTRPAAAPVLATSPTAEPRPVALAAQRSVIGQNEPQCDSLTHSGPDAKFASSQPSKGFRKLSERSSTVNRERRWHF